MPQYSVFTQSGNVLGGGISTGWFDGGSSGLDELDYLPAGNPFNHVDVTLGGRRNCMRAVEPARPYKRAIIREAFHATNIVVHAQRSHQAVLEVEDGEPSPVRRFGDYQEVAILAETARAVRNISSD